MKNNSPTPTIADFDWDTFWAFTSRPKFFNWVLYHWHYRQYEKLLKNLQLSNFSILELGAGTGIIVQRLIKNYGGRCVLVDNNESAYRLFLESKIEGIAVDYIRKNIFDLQTKEKFDLVCSDGLIEHYPEKTSIIELHSQFTKPGGYIIIFVPKESWFFRMLQSIGPTFGYEEHYSLSSLVKLCKEQGLNVLYTVDYFFEVGVLCQSDAN